MEVGNAQRYPNSKNMNDNRSHDPSSPKKGHLTLKPPTINDYVGTPVEHSKRMVTWLADRQPTHPQKVGNMIWEVFSILFLTDVACTLWKSACEIGFGKSCG